MELSYDAEEGDFDELVVLRSYDTPVLVDIGAEWCSPCRVLTPLLERLVAEYGGEFLLAKVDADENMKIAGRHKVRGFPTVVAYSRGEEVGRFHSAQTAGFLRSFINGVLERHSRGSHSAEALPQPA